MVKDYSLAALQDAVKKYHPRPDLALIERGYQYAENAHSGQVRASGEPYFNHLVATAHLAARLKVDVPTIVAALLHDTVEDCSVTFEELKTKFSEEIADLVQGVTKLTRTEFESREEHQAENFRKMLLAMAKDIRVILIKLCDRLHNMRTLESKSEEKRRLIALETYEIYAPLANRLGINWLKSELEDLSLKYLHPEIFEQISGRFALESADTEGYLKTTETEIEQVLTEAGISASVSGRAKHAYSVWTKMERNKIGFEEVHDLIGFRVIVSSLRACYEALGVMHATWRPVPGRFKDYIAVPKPNMYQSLHTTVIGPEGRRVEVQVRTAEMHRIAEEGIAAHWRYKESGRGLESSTFDLQWVAELVETQAYLKNPDEFIQSVKSELFPKEVFVFTPKGDLLRLSYGCTPLDFAYAVHTDVGHRTIGAKVNGQIVQLEYNLRNGDTIEVITQKNQVPRKDWLRFVKSTKARQRIRAFLKAEERASALVSGMELLTRELRKVKLSLKKLEKDGSLLKIAQEFGHKGEGDMYAELGYGKIAVPRILAKLLPENSSAKIAHDQSEQKANASPMRRIFQRAAATSRQRVGVIVSGFDDIVVRFARCCEPLPGDRIVGFISRGRGVTVHYGDCPMLLNGDPLRRVDVQWDTEAKHPRRVLITVHSQDQMGLLANVSRAITDSGANINSAQIKTTERGKATNTFEMTVTDAPHLERIKRAIERVPGVIKVERVIHLSEHD